jgi:hypothetical protein
VPRVAMRCDAPAKKFGLIDKSSNGYYRSLASISSQASSQSSFQACATNDNNYGQPGEA